MSPSEPPAPPADFPPFRRMAILGIGLIGGSIARAARRRDLAREIVACDRPGPLAEARGLGLADRYETDPAAAAAGADIVVMATPVGGFAGLAASIAPALAPGAVVTDTGSVKGAAVRDLLAALPPGTRIVPAHPMAGTEHSGPASGFAELFKGRWCLITPLPGTDREAVARVRGLWEAMGSMVAEMDPDHHDRVVAIVSHLPHLIAFTVCGTAEDLAEETGRDVLRFAAGGFRDFTRIAASDPVMWRDIFLRNRDALLEMLDRFERDARAMADAVRAGDGAYIERRVERGRAVRRRLIEERQA